MNSQTVRRTNEHVVATYECGECGYAHQLVGRRDVLPDGMDCRSRESVARDLYVAGCRGMMVLRLVRATDRNKSRMTS